jgi:hypothetical protein
MTVAQATSARNTARGLRDTAQVTLNNLVKARLNTQNEANEFKRQADENQKVGNTRGREFNMGIYSSKMLEVAQYDGLITNAENDLKIKQGKLNDAEEDLRIANDASEQKKLESQFAINNPATFAQIQIEKAATAAKAITSQATTKYLIIGAIALTVVVIVAVALRKKFAA